MTILRVERLGGLAGFGGARSHLRSRGAVDIDELPAPDQEALEALFRRGATATPAGPPDRFRYRLTRTTTKGTATVEVPEALVPARVAACVRDEIV